MSTKFITKMNLKCTSNPDAYRVSWLQNGKMVTVREQCLIIFNIGSYSDIVYLNFFAWMHVHVLLGRPWQYDRRVIHHGWNNTYQFEKDGKKFQLKPSNKEMDNEGKVMILSYVKGME